MTRRAAFTQADIERAIKAAKAQGETVQGVEIRPDGAIRVLTGAAEPQKPLSPYEAWEASRRDGERAA